MNSTYLISDFQVAVNKLIEQLEFPVEQVISLKTKMLSDAEFHSWTSDILKNKIEKIIIPLNLNTEDPIGYALKIAMHIRLNYEFEISKRNIPIIFLSDIRLDMLIKNYSFDSNTNLNSLFFTKGVYLSSFDTEKIKDLIEKAESCLDVDTKFEILDRLKFSPKATSGKHSLANAWGCFKLSQILNLKKELTEYANINEHLNTLYSKYLICLNNAYENKLLIDQNPLKFSQRKILVIDDQSDEGWSIIYSKLFISSKDTLKIIDSSKYKNSETKLFHDFNGFYNECLEQIGLDWDLIILDLRLHPELEDLENQVLNPTELSGYKLLDAFLNNNRGYQIIISTASNKIWNINAALDRGAKSYYIKESPEYNYSLKDTEQFFKLLQNDIADCNQLNFLKKFYQDQSEIEILLLPRKKPKHEKPLPKEFVDEVLKWLSLSNNILIKGKLEDSKIVSSFLFKFSILENISNRIIDTENPIFVEKDKNGLKKYKFQFRVSEKRLRNFIEDENGSGLYRKTKTVFESFRSLPWVIKILNAIDLITDEKLSDVQLNMVVKKRNDFIHSNSTTGDKINITTEDLIFLNNLIVKGLKNII